MSQAEELLNSMSEEIPVHIHPVPDTDTYFVIDPITRQIENTNRKKTAIMQYDHNSERFTFEFPRYIDGHDMLECTSVTVNVDNIETGVEEPSINSDAPDITDLRIHPNDPEKALCSWLISRNSTQLAGILSFHIEFKCVDSNGNVVYEWSTDNYDEIEVRARKKNGEAAVVEHTDLLEQWRTRIFGAGDSVMANIAAEGEAQVAAVKAESETQQEAVELKGAQTLDSIPEDYTEVDAMADEAVRSKGDAIVCEAAGGSIVLKDSSNDHIRGLKLFGKSTQFTTTGKNLLNVEENLSFTYIYDKEVQIPAGTYVLTFASETHGGTYAPYVCFRTNNVGALIATPGKQYIIELATDETQLYIYANNYSAANSEGISATINQLMLSVDGGDYEPYTGGKPAPNPDYPQEIVSIENPTIAIHSKNLIPFPYPMFACSNTEELDVMIRDDGGILINGTVTEDSFINLCKHDFGPDHISPSTTTSGFIANKYSSGIWVAYDGKNKISFILVKSGTVCNNEVIYPQVEVGTVATEYEKGSVRQSFDTDRTLPGIPVTSGGNYTDENGQQWICDEIDLERGVYVQRVANLVVNETSDVRMNVAEDGKTNGYAYRYFLNLNNIMINSETIMCDRLIHKNVNTLVGNSPENVGIAVSPVYSCIYLNVNQHMTEDTVDACKAALANYPLTVNYVLATPIETPLTAEEIEAFKAIKTNYPNTTILNDAGAWMSVKYNADTKTYVENPKTLKRVDSSTGLVYELKIVDGNLTVVQV